MAMSPRISIAIKIPKALINLVVLLIFRYGDEWYYLGASYNKNHDAEIFTTGVFMGFLLYNLISLISAFIDAKSATQSITEPLMSFFGAVLFITAGGVCLHYWNRFVPSNHFIHVNPAGWGLAMGSLAIILAVINLGELFIAFKNYRDQD